MENEIQTLDELLAQVTERRRNLLQEVVSKRTRHFCMVLEDLFDPHNISAVIRTAEVFGLQDVHIIEEANPYKVNKSILKGSFKWMSLYLYKKRNACMESLRAKGYKIAGTGTIEADGSVGIIGGIEHKILGAESSKTDYFLVPAGKNYKDALKYKKAKKLKVKLIKVKNIKQALKKLEELKCKTLAIIQEFENMLKMSLMILKKKRKRKNQDLEILLLIQEEKEFMMN